MSDAPVPPPPAGETPPFISTIHDDGSIEYDADEAYSGSDTFAYPPEKGKPGSPALPAAGPGGTTLAGPARGTLTLHADGAITCRPAGR